MAVTCPGGSRPAGESHRCSELGFTRKTPFVVQDREWGIDGGEAMGRGYSHDDATGIRERIIASRHAERRGVVFATERKSCDAVDRGGDVLALEHTARGLDQRHHRSIAGADVVPQLRLPQENVEIAKILRMFGLGCTTPANPGRTTAIKSARASLVWTLFALTNAGVPAEVS